MITAGPILTSRPSRSASTWIALAWAPAFALSACTEIEVGSQAYKTFAQANNPRVTRQANADPDAAASASLALQPDRMAFHAVGVTVWDGGRTLPGIWVAHPMATSARRVRLTNNRTGVQADAAMLQRNPGTPGPSIVVSSDAAKALGLHQGEATPITIEALAYGPVPAANASGVPAKSRPAPLGAPIETAPLETATPELQTAPPAAGRTGHPPPVTPPVPLSADAVLAADQPAGAEPPPRATPPAATDAPPHAQPVPLAADAVLAAEVAAGSVPAAAEPARIADDRPFIQAGIFDRSENAMRLVTELRAAGLPAFEEIQTRGGGSRSRVLVGPYATVTERNAAMRTVRSLGAADAFPTRG
jgi:cell division protein FtsN